MPKNLTTDRLMPVDVVFTWVNGADPAHREKRRCFEQLYAASDIRPDTRADHSLEVRYEDVGEIVFSIRSVLRYLPWVRTVFVVTDAQTPPVPPHLIESGRVRVVDHKELIPADYLPTFSNRVIESCLYRIPGLSEIFLYNNDDYMHFSPVPPSALFETNRDGRLRLTLWVKHTLVPRLLYWLSGLYPLGERLGSLHAIGIYRAYAMLRRRGIPAHGILVPRHSTQVIRRSTAQRLEEDFGEALDRDRRLKFRSLRSFHYSTLLYTMERQWNPEDRVRRAWLQDCSHEFRMFDFTGFMARGGTERLWRRVAQSKEQFVCLNNIPGTDRQRLLEVMAQKGLQETPDG